MYIIMLYYYKILDSMEIRNILFIYFFGVAARIDTSPAIREIVFIVTLLVLSHY